MTDARSGWQAPAGWYHLRARMRPDERHPVALHIQYQDPALGAQAIPLSAGAVDGNLASVLVLKGAARQLELRDEADAPLRVDALSMQPLPRWHAAVLMLRRLLWSRLRSGARGFDAVVAVVLSPQSGDARPIDVLLYHYLRPADGVGCPVTTHLLVPLANVAHWQPVNDLVAEGEGWRAVDDDPQFRLHTAHEHPLRLPAGWYRMRARMQVTTGSIVGPCLYAEHGPDAGGERAIALPDPDPQGTLDGIVLLRYPARSLRFDPSLRQVGFTLRSCRLQRIGRLQALVAMLSRTHRSDAGRLDWRGMGDAIGEFSRTWRRSGLTAAADTVRVDYEQRLAPDRIGYAAWTRRYDSFDRPGLLGLRERGARLDSGPLISILLPVYDTPERWLRSCLDSVLAQAYPRWELCIADDASPQPHVARILDEYARRDPRIRVTRRATNGHIAQATNTALEMAGGEYVALLDHDDELRPHALLEMAEAIVADPALELLYSDEDKLDPQGRRCQPYFKPDWNPDLLLSQNYLCHLSMIRTSRVRACGGFRVGYEGSQDHDLLLRCTRDLEPARIHHVPRVLYHWRAIPGSTALARDAKDYAAQAGARAVADHLRETGSMAQVEEMAHGHYRVRWPLPQPRPRISLIIPTRDRVGLLRTCIESVRERSSYPDYEIVVVDNQSSESDALAYLHLLQEQGIARVLRYDAPFNYSAINNWAAMQCTGELLCLLNNDIEVISLDWLEEMAGQAMRPAIGAVGAMLYYPDDTIQHAGVILGVGGVANHAYLGQPRGYPGHGARALVAQDLSAVTGACLMVRRELYLLLGGLDERLQVAFNDIDFCLRLRDAGYRNVWTPFAELYHHESASRGRDDSEEKQRRFRDEVTLMEDRWGALLHADPAYNPNLTLEGMSSELAAPPRR